jgi:hypothetical protein
VEDVLARAHKAWLDAPGKNGRPHKDHAMRRMLPEYSFPVPGYPPGWLTKYRERWDLLTTLATPPATPSSSPPAAARATSPKPGPAAAAPKGPARASRTVKKTAANRAPTLPQP